MLKGKLKGKKTYIVGALTILGAVAGYLVGDIDLATAVQTGVTALLAMTVRDGVNTAIAKLKDE